MGAVDDYIESLPAGAARDEVTRLHRFICSRVADVGQKTSYSLPCYTYRGVPLAAVVVRKHHIAWYPFSGDVLPMVQDQLGDHSWSPGTLRFTAAAPLSDTIVAQLIEIRMRHIDARSTT